MLLNCLKVGQHFKLENGKIFRVECNNWWLNGRLKEFRCVDANGNEKQFNLLDGSTIIEPITLVDSFESE